MSKNESKMRFEGKGRKKKDDFTVFHWSVVSVCCDHVMIVMSQRYLELLQHLEGEQLLSQVVSTFYNNRQQPPVRKVTVRRPFSDPPAGKYICIYVRNVQPEIYSIVRNIVRSTQSEVQSEMYVCKYKPCQQFKDTHCLLY